MKLHLDRLILIMTTRLFFLISLSIFLSCSKNKGAENCNYDDCAFVAPATEVQALETYLSANNIIATKHCSGLYYRIESAGTGKTPTVCNDVSVRYKGQLTNGVVFDSRTDPITFSLNGLIVGWKNGIPLIKEGGKIYLYLPPSLGYGNQPVGSIPAGSILVFEIDLVSVL